MTVYFLNCATIGNPEGMAEYRRGVGPILKKYGCRILAADLSFELIEGVWDGDSMVVIEAPDGDAIKQLLASDEYATLKALRQSSSMTNAIIVKGR